MIATQMQPSSLPSGRPCSQKSCGLHWQQARAQVFLQHIRDQASFDSASSPHSSASNGLMTLIEFLQRSDSEPSKQNPPKQRISVKCKSSNIRDLSNRKPHENIVADTSDDIHRCPHCDHALRIVDGQVLPDLSGLGGGRCVSHHDAAFTKRKMLSSVSTTTDHDHAPSTSYPSE